MIPTPRLCPEERSRRRLTWRNERKLYRRNCDATWNPIISIYSPDKPYKVYESKERYSDKRNALDYGFDFDFSKAFTPQFQQLMLNTPMLALIWANNENSDYVNLTADSKDCYMLIESSNNENCYHSYWLQQCKNCVDSCFCHACENCYEINNCFDSTNLQFSSDCKSCSNSKLLKNCTSCSNCFACINLQNQNYCIFNKQHTKEEYFQFIQEFESDISANLIKYKQKLEQADERMIKKYARVYNTENSVCDYMNNAQNCVFCVDGYDAQDCKYGEHIWRNAKNIMDASTVWRDAGRIYESINNWISVYHDMFIAIGRDISNCTYCYSCFNSKNLFGCVWLRNKEYCVFNKQYTKQEYEMLVPKIIAHMQKTWERGEFFPSSLSPFAYNESIAQEQYYLSKQEIIQKGHKYINDSNSKVPENTSTLTIEDWKQNINDFDDDIIQKIILCTQSQKPFRVIKQELEFYKRNNIPLPNKHPDIRHANRMKNRISKFYLRKCDKTNQDIVSIYPPESKFKVYNEDSYNQSVFR